MWMLPAVFGLVFQFREIFKTQSIVRMKQLILEGKKCVCWNLMMNCKWAHSIERWAFIQCPSIDTDTFSLYSFGMQSSDSRFMFGFYISSPKNNVLTYFFLSIIYLLLKKVNRTFHSKVIQMCCSIENSAEMYTCFMFLTRNRHLNDILPDLNAVKNVSSFFAVVNMCEICSKCLAYLLMPVLWEFFFLEYSNILSVSCAATLPVDVISAKWLRHRDINHTIGHSTGTFSLLAIWRDFLPNSGEFFFLFKQCYSIRLNRIVRCTAFVVLIAQCSPVKHFIHYSEE